MSIELSVRETREKYYKANGIPSDGGDSEIISKAKFGPITLYLLNFNARRTALKRHDIHHLIVEEDTSLRGEAIVGSWEVGSGIWPYWVASFLEPQAMSWGVLLAPIETFKWFKIGRRSKNFYKTEFKEEYLSYTIDELRKMVLPPSETDPTLVDFLLFTAWEVIGLVLLALSLFILLSPFILLATLLL